MLVINETLADLVGREIGYLAFRALGGIIAPPADPSSGNEADGQAADAVRFNFGKEMHVTRLRVDELLSLGNIEEAEAYMEKRRLLFVEAGFHIRKLNQAYFAFNGTYAEQPESSSPVVEQMKDIRAASADVSALIATVSKVSTIVEFEESHRKHKALATGGG
jgi:hypothetical protein